MSGICLILCSCGCRDTAQAAADRLKTSQLPDYNAIKSGQNSTDQAALDATKTSTTAGQVRDLVEALTTEFRVAGNRADIESKAVTNAAAMAIRVALALNLICYFSL